MMNCPNCDTVVEDFQYSCPYCGEDEKSGEGLFICPNCDTIFDWMGDEWVCPNCRNEGIPKREFEYDICPNCGGIIEDDGYCSDCGENEDVNQGWLGENY